MIRVGVTRDVAACVGDKAAAVTNRSLRLAKFPAMSDSRQDKEWRKGLLETIVSTAADAAGLNVRCGWFHNAVTFRYRLAADMIVDHAVGVIENSGLALDRHFGHPFIPGSAVKGIASVGAMMAGASMQERQIVFGWAPHNGDVDLPEDAPKAFAGTVVFFAAHPVRTAALGVDIVNCHHPEYYQQGGNREPTDNESPNPQFFMTVKAGAEFFFAVAPAGGNRGAVMEKVLGLPASFDPVLKAKEWLIRGITEHGVGAKTAAGYGWFTDKKATHASGAAGTAQQASSGDFNDKIFASVLKLADNKGLWQKLSKEVEKLKKPENADWFEKFKQGTSGSDYKELRKEGWYPK